MAKAVVTNKATGELIEFSLDTPEQIFMAYRACQEYEKAAKSIKDQIKKVLPSILDEQGRSKISDDGYQFKQYETQRQTYDMNTLREVFDEDTISLFQKVQKGLVDSYIKEHRDELGDSINVLKSGLVPDGNVTTSVRLEKVV